MDNVLIVCIGNVSVLNIKDSISEICNSVLFLDSDHLESYTALKNSENVYFINYDMENNLIDSFINIIPVSNIIIFSKIQFSCGENIRLRLDNLLGKIFIVAKCLYMPLMQQRKGNVWITEPQMECKDNCGCDGTPFLAGVNAGISSLTKIAALELSKKNICFNYLSGAINEYKIKKILEWSLKRTDIFLTAQELIT